MKPVIKAFLFLAILTILDFTLRKGMVPIPIPVPLPRQLMLLTFFTLFAALSWLVTKWYGKSDGLSMSDLGISISSKNRIEFFYGLICGIVLWGIVSIVQSFTAGFAWELRPNASLAPILYGLLFIFIADLGTELFTRGYPLTKLKDSFGFNAAIIIMVLFVGLKSYSFNVQGELLFYIILIPALHTIFFSIIYFKTKRLGGALGVHTGANFITISIFDLRTEQAGQAIPAGLFQPDMDLDTLSLTALQLPYILMAVLFSVAVYFWWVRY